MDNVNFDDSTGNTTVQIDTQVIPGSIVVNSTNNNYTFQGAGTISGAASLTKSGSSTLTISTNNNYTGGTTINGGTLAVTTPTPFVGTVTINNGAALAGIEVNQDNELSFGAGANYVIPSAASATISLINNNSGSSSATAAPVVGVAMNGTLSGGTTSSGATANIVVSNTNPGATLPVLTDFAPNNTAFIGTINFLNNGTTTVRLGANSGSAATYWNLGSSGTLATNTGASTIALGALTGGAGATLQGFVGYTLNSGGTVITNAAGGLCTFQVGSLGVDSTFSGAILDGIGTTGIAVSIDKFGNDTLTLAGSNGYTGTTTISAGTLVLGVGGSINNSGTIALAGGTFDSHLVGGYSATSKTITGTGTIVGNVTHTTGTLIPGTAGNRRHAELRQQPEPGHRDHQRRCLRQRCDRRRHQ